MKPAFVLSVALTGNIVSYQALAELDMRPGLWEHSFTVVSRSAGMENPMLEMQQQLASMTPEQRRMMEQMMASQGVQLGSSGQSAKVCVTREEAARGEVPQKNGYCSQEIIERDGNTIKTRFHCADNPPSSGEGEVTFSSPFAYTGKAVIHTTVEGSLEQMTVKQSGKWLSLDCGSLQP